MGGVCAPPLFGGEELPRGGDSGEQKRKRSFISYLRIGPARLAVGVVLYEPLDKGEKFNAMVGDDGVVLD